MASKDYYEKLINKDVPASFIADIVNSKKYGDNINKNEYKTILNKWDKKDEELNKKAPDEIKDNPSWKSMTWEEKEMALYSYEIQLEDNEEKARMLDQALDMATQQADPYWKSIIRVFQDETVRSFDEAKGDFQSTKERLERRQKEISEDLARNKENLGIEEQAELNRISRGYDNQKTEVINTMADRGLTFGTGEKSRIEAEKQLNEENQDIVESTKRTYAKQVQDLQVEADRGNTEAQKQLEDLQREYGDRITNIGRSAESYLGTDIVKGMDLEGYNPLNNVTGQLYEDKAKDVELRKETNFNELTQNSLQF